MTTTDKILALLAAFAAALAFGAAFFAPTYPEVAVVMAGLSGMVNAALLAYHAYTDSPTGATDAAASPPK